MKQNNFLKGKGIFPLTLLIIFSVIIAFRCVDRSAPEAGGGAAAITAAPVKAAFHHLRMDKSFVVNSLDMGSSDFKKLLFGYRVNDYNHFPDSLTLAAYAAKNNSVITVNQPYVLSILPEADSLLTDLTFSTLELNKAKLTDLVGPNGTSVTYDYLVFIPYVKYSVGKKFLSYRVDFRPRPGGGAGNPQETNPCPPFKPD